MTRLFFDFMDFPRPRFKVQMNYDSEVIYYYFSMFHHSVFILTDQWLVNSSVSLIINYLLLDSKRRKNDLHMEK